jgi:hypothetical protein
MKILLLSDTLTDIPKNGPSVKTINLLRYLSQQHEVTLVSFAPGEQEGGVEELRQ